MKRLVKAKSLLRPSFSPSLRLRTSSLATFQSLAMAILSTTAAVSLTTLAMTVPPRLRPIHQDIVEDHQPSLMLFTMFPMRPLRPWPQPSSTAPCLADSFTQVELQLSSLVHLLEVKRRLNPIATPWDKLMELNSHISVSLSRYLQWRVS